MSPSEAPAVSSHCEAAFEPLRIALADILTAGSEIGVALAVDLDGRSVVDLWAGHEDAARTRPWRADTIVNLYSIGKAVTAVCALRLADAGPSPSACWVRVRARSAISGRAARWASPIPTRGSRFGYVMTQGRGGWQHKHVRHLIDLIYDAL